MVSLEGTLAEGVGPVVAELVVVELAGIWDWAITQGWRIEMRSGWKG